MAWEVRVLAEPDFPVTIFVELQTNITSAGLTNFSFTNRSIPKSPSSPYQPTQPAITAEKFWKRGLGENFFQKVFPQETSPQKRKKSTRHKRRVDRKNGNYIT